MLWLLMLIIIALSVAISSNIIIVNSTGIDDIENYTNYSNINNNFTLACNISLITCLNNNPTYLKKIEDHNIQIDLILEQVN